MFGSGCGMHLSRLSALTKKKTMDKNILLNIYNRHRAILVMFFRFFLYVWLVRCFGVRKRVIQKCIMQPMFDHIFSGLFYLWKNVLPHTFSQNEKIYNILSSEDTIAVIYSRETERNNFI